MVMIFIYRGTDAYFAGIPTISRSSLGLQRATATGKAGDPHGKPV